MLEHIERLRALQALDLPNGIERQIHQNRLLKIAREGGQMTPADLAKFEPQCRYATLVWLVTRRARRSICLFGPNSSRSPKRASHVQAAAP